MCKINMHVAETEFVDYIRFTNEDTLRRENGRMKDGTCGNWKNSFKSKRIPSIKKAKFGITPPSSPTTPKENGHDGFYSNNIAASPRLISEGGDGEIDGQFQFLEGFRTNYPEVFTITTGNGSTLPKKSQSSPPGAKEHSSPADKYKWTDGDSVDRPDHRKVRTRKICCIVLVTILVLVLLAGVAVILAFKVFNVGEETAQQIPTTIRPDYLVLAGSLDLKEDWNNDLYNSSSPLYIDTASTFVKNMNIIMSNSSFSDFYSTTQVLGFSPGSIKVLFDVLMNKKYQEVDDDVQNIAVLLEDHIKQNAQDTITTVDIATVRIVARTATTSSTTPSTTASTTRSSTTTVTPTTDSSTTPTTTTASTTTSVSTTTEPTTTTTSTSTTPSTTTTASTTTSTSTTPSTTTTASTTTSTTTESTTTETTSPTTPHGPLCETVAFDTCRTRGFTLTVYPNLVGVGQMNEADAAASFNEAASSVFNRNCEEAALTYLCSLYFPKCDVTSGMPSYPCRSLCEEAVSTCSDYFSNPWGCENFQETGCVALPVTTTVAPTTVQPVVCEETQLQVCVDLGFNETYFPNLLREANQAMALVTYNNLKPSIEAKCADDVQYFICSVQFPKCEYGMAKKPCRRICESIMANCPNLNFFNCTSYPEYNCMAPPQPAKAIYLPMKGRKMDCTANEFSCATISKCVSADRVCDAKNDCSDWSDEMDCSCSKYQYQCNMGMCIKSYEECDGKEQCPDGSDEDHCTSGCTKGQLTCPDGKCIMAEWLCDGRAECSDGWDERNCDVCPRSQFTCADKTCVNLTTRCDYKPDCTDGYDEWNCIRESNGILQIPYKKYWLPVCADSWSDMYGPHVCESLLGQGSYVSKTDVDSNVYTFVSLTDGGTVPSILGPISVTNNCSSRRVVSIKCEPRGCGKRLVDNQVSHIVNGEDARPGAWPWHVGLYMGTQYFCGGTIINSNFILTAAHCIERYLSDFDLMVVKVGANFRTKKETTTETRRVEAITSHSDHVYFVRNDIALIEIYPPLTFTNYIQPVCLPSADDELPIFSECYTLGWGKVKWDGDYAEVLQELKMTLWDTQKCNSSIAWKGQVYDTFLCAGYYSGVRSICKGDSGGPLLCLDRRNTWKLVGISSYVANDCNKPELPNIFTVVQQFTQWIDDKIECKFECDNGKCLYHREQICDRTDNCGDNSDEVRLCNRTATCDFEDKFLCGYEYTGWKLGYDNKLSARMEIGGVMHTQSTAPQFDHTVGRYPGNFFYGKQKGVSSAELWTPRFNVTGNACLRFAYYLRGEIDIGMKVQLFEYYKSGSGMTEKQIWTSARYHNSIDEWKTGYFDLSFGEFKLKFVSNDQLKTAIDDIKLIDGLCNNVLCDTKTEFWCKGSHEDKCVPTQSLCNLVIDCDNGVDEDNATCAASSNAYKCTFENGNLCNLHQNVGDATDWWLVNASFVRDETKRNDIVDHTSGTDDGFLFYVNTYGLQQDSAVYMGHLFALHRRSFCFSFYYELRSDVIFNIQIEDNGLPTQISRAETTFNGWTKFQVNLPLADVVNITYVIEGVSVDTIPETYLVLDDIYVTSGVCSQYVCPKGWKKCKSYDRCVPPSSICDRNVDCWDESDEEQCNCTAAEFQCDSGRCIPSDNACDRQGQCMDISDEKYCDAFTNVSCTFEHPYVCGYEFIQHSKYAWHRINGSTPTPITGPIYDHTLKTDKGFYLFTEGHDGSKGDKATLMSPAFDTGYGKSLTFFYHIFSFNTMDTMPGVLQLSIVDTATKVETIMWQSTILMQDKWVDLCIDLPNNINANARFTSIRNESTDNGVDMAIDDIKFNNHLCSETTTTVKPQTTTTMPESTTAGDGCPAGKRVCRSGTCINSEWFCDGESDCNDGSDEFDCPAG